MCGSVVEGLPEERAEAPSGQEPEQPGCHGEVPGDQNFVTRGPPRLAPAKGNQIKTYQKHLLSLMCFDALLMLAAIRHHQSTPKSLLWRPLIVLI